MWTVKVSINHSAHISDLCELNVNKIQYELKENMLCLAGPSNILFIPSVINQMGRWAKIGKKKLNEIFGASNLLKVACCTEHYGLKLYFSFSSSC